MINEVNTFLKQIENFREEVQIYCRIKSIPLEKRWSVFEKCGVYLGEDKDWNHNFKSLPDEFIMYDGEYHVDRHQTVIMINVVDYIIECYGGNDINLDKFKEEILKEFIWSFVYDW